MVKEIKAWAIIKNGKLDALEIYKDKDIVVPKGEKMVRVKISLDK